MLKYVILGVIWDSFQYGSSFKQVYRFQGQIQFPRLTYTNIGQFLLHLRKAMWTLSRRSCLDVQVSGMVLEYPNYKRKTHRNEVKSTNFHPLWESSSYNLLEQPMVSCLFILQGFQTWPKACGIINQSNLRQVDDRICPNVSRTKENKLAFQICGCSMLEPA